MIKVSKMILVIVFILIVIELIHLRIILTDAVKEKITSDTVKFEEIPKIFLNGLEASRNQFWLSNGMVLILGLTKNDNMLFHHIKGTIYSTLLMKSVDENLLKAVFINNIHFDSCKGKQIVGLTEASLCFFSKKPEEMDINESSTLAALSWAPKRYLTDRSKLKEKRNKILDILRNNGFISQIEFEASKGELPPLSN